MEYIFAGIDGTGVRDDIDYAAEFRNSFVHRLYHRFGHPNIARYNRGPNNAGNETDDLAMIAFEHVKKWHKPNRPVILAGYSRGGAAVIEAAKWLRAENILVHCLVLFDAVDRTFTVGGLLHDTPISRNVMHCIHAMRAIESGSRSGFGGCGMDVEDRGTTDYVYQPFFGTHGSLGGTPWPVLKPGQKVDERQYQTEKFLGLSVTGSVTKVTTEQEHQVVREIWRWTMNEFERVLRAIELGMAGADKVKPPPKDVDLRG